MLYIYIYSVHSKKSQYYDKFVYKWAKYALYCNIYKSKKFIRVLKDFTIFFGFLRWGGHGPCCPLVLPLFLIDVPIVETLNCL